MPADRRVGDAGVRETNMQFFFSRRLIGEVVDTELALFLAHVLPGLGREQYLGDLGTCQPLQLVAPRSHLKQGVAQNVRGTVVFCHSHAPRKY